MNQPEFRSTSAMSEGEDWKPHALETNGFYFDPQNPNNVIMGFLKKFAEDIPTKNGPMVKWVIQTCNPTTFQFGPIVSIIQDTVLQNRRDQIPINGFIRITYQGRGYKKGVAKEYTHPQTGQVIPTPISKTNSYHMWDVAVWDGCPKTFAEAMQMNGLQVPTQAPVYNAAPMPQAQAPVAPAPQFQQQPSVQQPMNQQVQQPAFQQGAVQQPAFQQPAFQQGTVNPAQVANPAFQQAPAQGNGQFQQGTVQQPPQFQQPPVQNAPPAFQQPPVFQQQPVQQQPANGDIITNQNAPYPTNGF